MAAILTRDMILKAKDVPTEEVEIPEWGGSVYVRGLTGRQRDDFEATLLERKGKKMAVSTANLRAKLVVRCMYNEKGQRILMDGDADALGEHSALLINRVFEVAQRLSGINQGDLDELTEDFGSPSGDASPSASPSGSENPGASS